MIRTVKLSEQDEKMVAELCELRNSQNISGILREALLVLWKNFFGQSVEKSNNNAVISSEAAAQQPAASSPAPRQVCLERVAVVTLGLESDLAPLEGIESRLTEAGWHGLRWQSGTLFGRHPDYKEIELPLVAQVER